MNIMQEKFQITVPAKEEAGEGWVSADSQRDLRFHQNTERRNAMPPGMDISNQFFSEQNQQRLSVGGQTDISRDVNPQAFAKGFTRKELNGSDDQYTGEHVDHFYGDAGGFAERNNYLDRL